MLHYHERADAVIAATRFPDAHQRLLLPPTPGLRDWRTGDGAGGRRPLRGRSPASCSTSSATAARRTAVGARGGCGPAAGSSPTGRAGRGRRRSRAGASVARALRPADDEPCRRRRSSCAATSPATRPPCSRCSARRWAGSPTSCTPGCSPGSTTRTRSASRRRGWRPSPARSSGSARSCAGSSSLDGQPVRAVRAVDTATHPDHQGRGVFTALTEHALDGLRDDGVGVRVQHAQRAQPPRLPEDGLAAGAPAARARPPGVARGRSPGSPGPGRRPTSGRSRRAAGIAGSTRRSPTRRAVEALLGVRCPTTGLRTRRSAAYLALALRLRAARLPGGRRPRAGRPTGS